MSEAGLTRDEREALVEVIADQMRNLSVRIGPKEFAVPLMRGVDLAVEVDAAVTAIVAAREQAAYERGAADVRAAVAAAAEDEAVIAKVADDVDPPTQFLTVEDMTAWTLRRFVEAVSARG